jgi:4a-hydroxytetrahydrobiopterin dehydratase
VHDDARPTRQQISEAVDPAGWRLVLGAIYTEVLAPSLSEAAEAASLSVSAVGADGQGHLAVDIRADRAVLRLQSSDVGGVTGHDIRLAHNVSEALAARGFRL